MTELVFTHAELGGLKYRAMAERCAATFTGEVAQLADMKSEPIRGATAILRLDFTTNNFALKRIEALKDYLKAARGDVIAADCDMVWKRETSPLFDADFDIGVCWRTGSPSMPYYAGFVMIRHGSEAARQFITDWWFTIACQPKDLQPWWGDQIALAAMLGQQRPNTTVDINGCMVRIFDAGRVFFNMQSEGQKHPDGVYAIHFKGDKKGLV